MLPMSGKPNRARDRRHGRLQRRAAAGQRTLEAGAGAWESATALSASSRLRRTLMATAAVTPEPAAAGRRHERPRVGAVAGGVDPVDGRRLLGVDGDGAVVAQPAAQRTSEMAAQLP